MWNTMRATRWTIFSSSRIGTSLINYKLISIASVSYRCVPRCQPCPMNIGMPYRLCTQDPRPS
jgi:hypothetical protein